MSKKTKKVMSLILIVSILSVMLFSLSSCNKKEEPEYESRYISYEIFNEYGEIIGDYSHTEEKNPHYGVYNHTYNGKPCKLTIDVLDAKSSYRYEKYDQVLIEIYKYNNLTYLLDYVDGGFQNEELEWPTEYGNYEIRININPVYETINGKEYLQFNPSQGKIVIKIIK